MSNTYVVFDSRSGRIVGVHYGADDAKQARKGVQAGRLHETKLSDENIDVITVPAQTIERGKRYKVDLSRKVLMMETADEGVGFSVGVTARSSSKPAASS